VRATLAGVGLVVGAGPRVGAKSSGTLASWSAVVPPLDPRAARRVEKRSGRAPLGKKSSQAE
jgi:hypothetical protein